MRPETEGSVEIMVLHKSEGRLLTAADYTKPINNLVLTLG